MLQSKTKWNFTDKQNESLQWSDDSIGLSPITLDLLSQRGITTTEAAKTFLSPELTNLYEPKSLLNIDEAAGRVHKAIAQNEKILVYGDYDADGVSSTTVMLEALQELGATCDFYIPNRFTEGYGPNENAFKEAAENGCTLIITVDTGIASVHEADVAKELGIDLIITDHHEVQEHLPDAFAIIHPKCSPDYGFHELAGVGVAFKFAEYLLGYFPKHLLDLVAIGTIADMVPLTSENRILAYYGLQALTATERPGLKALKKICKIQGNVTEEDVGFLIGPRLNAVGRLQGADLAVELLMTEDQQEAEELAEMVQSLNKERQKIVSTIANEAEKIVDERDELGVIVVAKEGWNEGVLGIVASRLVRKYDRPAIVLTVKPDTNEVKGSARSIPAFDLFANCMKIKDVFTHFGGHAQAAGMSLPKENVERLQNELNDLITAQLTEDDFTQMVDISKTLSISEINESLVNEINKLAPFGMANPKPIFHFEHVPSELRQIGSMQKHLKVQFRQEKITIDGIGFGMGNLYPYISHKTPISIIGELSINEWNGNRKVQFVMQDLAINTWQLFDHRGKKQLSIGPFVQENKSALAIGLANKDYSDRVPDQVSQISYGMDTDTIQEVDTVFILDLPAKTNQLQEIIKQANPVNIHACYYIEDSAYMKAFPSREDFIWFYALVRKRRSLDLKKELNVIMDTKSWTKDRIIFISKVFYELEFVKIENGVIHLSPDPAKKDLQESELYQARLKQAEIEKTLYFSNYDTLKIWFTNCMKDEEMPKEEAVTHGL